MLCGRRGKLTAAFSWQPARFSKLSPDLCDSNKDGTLSERIELDFADCLIRSVRKAEYLAGWASPIYFGQLIFSSLRPLAIQILET